MNSLKNIERLQWLHKKIQKEVTGSPKELAKTLEISERMVYCLIDQLRDFNALVKYDRVRKTYRYEEEFDLDIKVSISIISKNETTQIIGGFFGPRLGKNIFTMK